MAIRFFYLPRGKKYNYIPRYYDEQKEELEKRKRLIDAELAREGKIERSDDIYIPSIKGQMRRFMKSAKRERRKSSLRMLIILVILIVLSYLILIY